MNAGPQGIWAALSREAALLARDRTVWAWWGVVLLLAALAVASGLHEVAQQRSTLSQLQAADRAEREAVQLQQKDWGGAAYASFHLTFDAPSNLAFAALGRRDDTAWKHRIRVLALEGQIHERDAGHPELALVGRFDLAFLVAFGLPLVLILLLHDLRASATALHLCLRWPEADRGGRLGARWRAVLILLLHDLRASERLAGRHDLLLATAGKGEALWRWRALLRVGGVAVAVALPLLVGGLIAGTAATQLAAALAAVLAYVAFWALLAAALSAWRQPGEVILAALLGLWLLLAVLLPALLREGIERAVPLPAGADIVLLQREAVNDAWDLPKAATMDAFVARHPEWAAHAAVERPFEWKWYYAFQQVGDQQAEALSRAYTEGRLARERWAAGLAWLAPPVLLERTLQSLAHTDAPTALAYEARVRAHHGELRRFYYPRLFLGEPFDPAAGVALPTFPFATQPVASPP
jgi:ABC-2 type transport system permease protein